MPITLDGVTRPKATTTNALSATIAVGSVVEVDTGGEESFFIPLQLGATDPASFTVSSVSTTSSSPTITTTGGGFSTVKVGDALSGTGISGRTVQSKSNDNNTITMDGNASATGSITLTVDPPSATPVVAAIKIVLAKGGSSLTLVPTLYLYDGSLGSVTTASTANATKTIRLAGTGNESMVIDLDDFLTKFRVPRSA